MQLVPTTTLEEIEHALLTRQIAECAAVLASLQRELVPLERAFSAFEQRVARQSAPVASERDRLRHICSEIERFTARIHARLEADPDGLMTSLFTPDELRYIGDLFDIAMPEDWFEPVSHATTSADSWEWTDRSSDDRRISPSKRVAGGESADLRSLYKQLARTFHPDLTTDPGERHFRQEMMLRINHAWEMRDLPTMQSIRDDVHDLLTGHLLSAAAYRLAWQRRELAHLVNACQECRTRLTTLRSSKTVTLWHDSALANAAIARHIKRLQQEISHLTLRRGRAVEEFRLALGSYSAHRS